MQHLYIHHAYTYSRDLHGVVDFAEVGLELVGSEQSELLVLANGTHRDIVLTELGLLCTGLEGTEAVLDQLLLGARGERLKVLLKVGLGRLGARADGHSDVLVVVARGARLEEVSAGFVDAANQEAHTEGPLGGVVSLDRGLLRNLAHQSLRWVMAVMGVPVVQALAAHELAEVASVCSQAGDSDAHVVVNVEHLLLVACQVMRALLQ